MRIFKIKKYSFGAIRFTIDALHPNIHAPLSAVFHVNIPAVQSLLFIFVWESIMKHSIILDALLAFAMQSAFAAMPCKGD